MTHAEDFSEAVRAITADFDQRCVDVRTPGNQMRFIEEGNLNLVEFCLEDDRRFPRGVISLAVDKENIAAGIGRTVTFNKEPWDRGFTLLYPFPEESHSVLKVKKQLDAAVYVARNPLISRASRLLLSKLTPDDLTARRRWENERHRLVKDEDARIDGRRRLEEFAIRRMSERAAPHRNFTRRAR